MRRRGKPTGDVCSDMALRPWRLPMRLGIGVSGFALFLSLALPGVAQSKELRVAPPGAQTQVADGTYATLGEAMAVLQPGDHLVIQAGVYRETLQFPARDWTSASNTIIEGSGVVQINGADLVTEWTAAGNGEFYTRWQHEPAQVAIDGTLLQQIGGTVFDGFPTNGASEWTGLLSDIGGIWPGRVKGVATDLPPASFAYDAAAGRLYVRPRTGALTGHTVEVGARAFSAYGTGLANVTLKNLTFRLGNTSISSRAGLVTIEGNHLVLDHVSVSEADSVGVELDGDDNAMHNVMVDHCGQLGIKARGERVLIADTESDFNNMRGFNKWWEAGGAKFIGDDGLRDSVVTAFTAIGNLGDGIWFDWNNQRNRVEKSLSEYNTGFGIQYEASYGASIVDNIIVGNGQRGIYLPHSSNSLVAWNLVAGNALQGIAVIDEGRIDPEHLLDLRPHGNVIFGNVIAWNGSALTLPVNIADNKSDANIFIDDSSAALWSLGWHGTLTSTLPAWTEVSGQDRHSERLRIVMDAPFRASIEARQRAPELGWFRTLRQTLTPVTASELAGMGVPVTVGMPTDARPGPAL